MRKTIKLTLITLLALALIFVVTGCGEKKENQETNKQEKANVQQTSKSKAYNVLSKMKDNYIISLEENQDMGSGEENAHITMAVKGKNMSIDAESESQHITIMYKDNTTYMISHNDKKYVMQAGKTEEQFDNFSIFNAEGLKQMENQKYETGKEKIDGKEYDYEKYEYAEKGETEIFYFLGEEVKYVKDIYSDGKEVLMKINKLSANVDDSVFEIPKDYEKIEV